MAGGSGNGLATAVELAGGFGALGLDGASQDDMFADADDAPMPMPEAPRTGRAGRPKGARNRSTKEWQQHILSRYRSPAVFLAELYSRTPAELARELGLYKFHEGKLVTATVRDPETGDESEVPVLATGDAAAMQVQAAIALLPYVHQKQPMAIDVQTTERGLLLMGTFDGEGQSQSDALTIPFAPTEQNQQVSDAEIVQSDDEQSDATANPMTNQDNASDGH